MKIDAGDGLNEPRPRMLSEEQLRAVHETSLEILERTGCVIPHAEALALLDGAGARIEGQRAYIPGHVVERSLATLRPVTLYNRLGEPALPLGGGRVTFGALVDNLYVQDPYEPRMRPFLRADLAWSSKLLDALPGIDWLECSGQMHDVAPEVQTQLAYSGTVRHTAKPIIVYPYDRGGLLDILDVASAIAGSEQAFRRRPFIFCASVPAAPLKGADYNVDVLLACAEYEVPVVYHPHPAMGANSPCSIPGTLVLANADWLAGMTVHQLKRPGAPVCSAGFTELMMDMRTTLWSYCAPEMLTAYSAVADLAHWYGMPAFGLEMLADTPQLDAQAGFELGMTCAWALQTGTELVHSTGLLGACKVCSAAASVLADEIIAYTRTAVRSLKFTAAELQQASGLIEQVGPKSDYLTHPHTLDHFRDFWYPGVMQRSMFDAEHAGVSNSLDGRLEQRARRLIETHVAPPLPEGVAREIERLEATWLSRRSR